VPACLPHVIESADDSTGTDLSDSGSNPGEGVDLGAAGEFVILATSEISTTTPSVITGDVGLSPGTTTSISGFALTTNETNGFSKSPQIHGSIYCADHAPPTPSELDAAVEDMALAFDEAKGRTAETIDLGACQLDGLTLEPGVYAWTGDLSILSDVRLDGSATDVWIFQIAEDLSIGSGTKVVLSGGAQATNVVWQVDGRVDIGTMAHGVGIVLAKAAATLHEGASLDGRLLVQTAVSMQSSTVVEPAE
jgi:hypothetical protein